MIKIYSLNDNDLRLCGWACDIKSLRFVCDISNYVSNYVNESDYDKIEASGIFVFSKTHKKYHWSIDEFFEEIRNEY